MKTELQCNSDLVVLLFECVVFSSIFVSILNAVFAQEGMTTCLEDKQTDSKDSRRLRHNPGLGNYI